MSALRAIAGLAAFLFGVVVRTRNALYDRSIWPCRVLRAPIPVLSVGNLSAGGSGKSVVAAHLAAQALALGVRPAIVSRGYGGEVVAGASDEALEQRARLANAAAVFCEPDRLKGVRRAAATGAQLAILDDGFQHRRLARDVDLVLLDLLDTDDNRHLLPRGMLREPLSALRRATLLMMTRADVAPPGAAEDLERRVRAAGYAGKIVRAAHRPSRLRLLGESDPGEPPSVLAGRRVLLASGLGNPQGFEQTVRALGAEVLGHVRHRDHHRWRPADITAIDRRLEALGADVLAVTTGKDGTKISPLEPGLRWRVLEVELELLNGAAEIEELLVKLAVHPAESLSTS